MHIDKTRVAKANHPVLTTGMAKTSTIPKDSGTQANAPHTEDNPSVDKQALTSAERPDNPKDNEAIRVQQRKIARQKARERLAADLADTSKKKKKRKRTIPIYQFVLLFIGLAMLAYPIIADRIAAHQANEIISSYSEYTVMDPEEINRLLNEAQAYNDQLSGTPNDYEGEIPKASDLIVSGDLPFAWIEFPTLAEKLPVYHGTSEETLQAGVGNLERTSIPIGGVSTHAVLTGHSGMPGSRMFDDIDRLNIGDVFMVHTLNLDMAYKVISTEVVWPDEIESLRIQDGRDLITLITCTPYGVNDHRLLVHAERTDYDAALELPSSNLALFFNHRTIPFIAALAFMILFFFGLNVRRRMRYPMEIGVDESWNGLSDYTDDRRRYVGDKGSV